MGKDGSLESRLKAIRKELSLIDKDLKTLSGAAADPTPGAAMPRIKSKELRQKEESRSSGPVQRPVERSSIEGRPVRKPVTHAKKTPVLQPQGSEPEGKDGRFVEYLSSSFHSGGPLGQERRIQRNKAILMLVIVLFILFFVLYRLST